MKWTKQPPAGTPIDWGNPITKDLVFAGPDLRGVNMVPNSNLTGAGTWQSTVNQRYPTPYGLGINNPDNDTGGIEWTDEQIIDDDSSFTVLVYGNPISGAVIGGAFNVGDGATRLGGLMVNSDETGVAAAGQFVFLVANTATHITAGASQSTTMIDGDWHVFVGQGTPGTSNVTKLWRDGIALTLDTLTAGNTTGWSTGTLSTGVWKGAEDVTDACPVGSMVLALCWKRLLTDVEVQSISANPWQIFKPKSRFALADVPENTEFERVKIKRTKLPW